MGSFFNVCIYRIPRGLSLSFPGSHCYRCGRPVRWYDNVPLLSYWILRGRCRQCGAPFSCRYFVVELLTACLFTLFYLRLGYSLTLISGLIFLSLLIVATFTDIDHWIIPDRTSLGGLGVGLVLAALGSLLTWRGISADLLANNPLSAPFLDVAPALRPLVNALAGAAIGFAGLWGIGAMGSLIFRKEAMGFGDVKLFAMFGAFCGPMNLLFILFLSCLIGTLMGAIGFVFGRLSAHRAIDAAVAPLTPQPALAEALASVHPLGETERVVIHQALGEPGSVGPVRHHLPFGPSLALAAVIVYLYGPEINQWFNAYLGLSGASGGGDWGI